MRNRAEIRRYSRLFVLLGLLVSTAVWADPPAGYPFVAYDEGLRQADSEGKPVFLYFGRYGCGWCEKTNKESFSDERVRQAYEEHYVLVYVDAESGNRLTLPNGERLTEMELGARMNVFATPVFAYLEKDGEMIFKAPGFKTAEEFLAFDRYVAGGHYQKQELLEFLRGDS
ncbi:thioredoxin family protein [Thiohalomonas denitrificans]|uniref:Thioredoxin-related protein n=1 Tax=Thiohalomonas denitrificans TaxID=415747 RepID=A0A1G5PR08_9GAMM|nr:thioredoxin fold domain-containing protein [Thiohalomonas denitrificans]SCZ52014.1 Thioredoxin-related protein [Thiohalomonas denitrificans]